MKQKIERIAACLKDSSGNVKLSIVIMGGGQFKYGARGKGMLFFLLQLSILYYFAARGFKDIVGFFTLGTKKGDAWLGVAGDNSVVMLLMGIFAWCVLAAFLFFYIMNISDACRMQKRLEQGKRNLTFKEEVIQFWDKKFYITVLVLPAAGVFVFNVLPIIFMILIAFTNYGGTVVPPELVDWVGFSNFTRLLSLSQFAPTFVKILGWNLLWAVAATALNYFAGLFLALLLDKDCVKGKALWRMFPILAYAIPGFITLLAFKFMFSYGGPFNQLIIAGGGTAVGFLDLDAKWMARLIGLLVNCWISTPSIMLLATGILSNRDSSLYEAARIDGAGRWKQFSRITMPFVLFSTLPVLIGQFVGNFNNFGIFYFLRGGLYLDGYFLASDTDLLINWLYNLSINNNYYCLGAAISLVIFVITSVISLVVYIKSPSYREEDTFR